MKAYQIPLGSRVAKGVPLPQVLPISSEEQVRHMGRICCIFVVYLSDVCSVFVIYLLCICRVFVLFLTSIRFPFPPLYSLVFPHLPSLSLSLVFQVTSVIPVDSYAREDEHLVLMTSKGFVKKTPLKAFQSISARGLIIISLGEWD